MLQAHNRQAIVYRLHTDIHKKLKEFLFLKKLNDQELDLLANEIVEKTIPKKDIFIEQGDEDDSIYFICDGLVKIYRLTAEGQNVNLAVAGSGETIGEMSPIFGGVRSAFCEAQSDVTALILPGESYRNLIREHPDIALAFLQVFCERLSQANKYIEEVVSLDLKERTLKLLYTLSKHFPDKNINATHEEIASILSATRPRVSEVLQELEDDGEILISHKNIKVLSK